MLNSISDFRTVSPETRRIPWHVTGTAVRGSETSAEAMRKAGLDWEVVQRPVYCDGAIIPGRYGMVRREVGKPNGVTLGIVSKRYTPVQNVEAFDFFDSLIGGVAEYDRVGVLGNGSQIYLTAKLTEQYKVADDIIDTYLLLSNSHDGGSALRVAITPIRVACFNTLALAFRKAKRSWKVHHTRDIVRKMSIARESLGLTSAYMDAFREFGDRSADMKVGAGKLEALADALFSTTGDKKRGKTIEEKKRDQFEACLRAPDLAAYRGTVWGVLNAVSDYETHYGRYSRTMQKIVGNRLSLFDKAYAFLTQAG